MGQKSILRRYREDWVEYRRRESGRPFRRFHSGIEVRVKAELSIRNGKEIRFEGM